MYMCNKIKTFNGRQCSHKINASCVGVIWDDTPYIIIYIVLGYTHILENEEKVGAKRTINTDTQDTVLMTYSTSVVVFR